MRRWRGSLPGKARQPSGRRRSLKRMLAYSSIAHAGYILVGLIAGGQTGKAAVLFYLATYAITNIGAFGIVAVLATRDRAHDQLADFAGLWHRRPVLAGLMAVFLLSLGGFPPTAGFIGKWYIFNAAVQQEQYALAIVGVLTSVVSVFYYLRIVVMMYMTERADTTRVIVPVPAMGMAALAISIIAIFYLGILPAQVMGLAAASADDFQDVADSVSEVPGVSVALWNTVTKGTLGGTAAALEAYRGRPDSIVLGIPRGGIADEAEDAAVAAAAAAASAPAAPAPVEKEKK